MGNVTTDTDCIAKTYQNLIIVKEIKEIIWK